MKTVIDSNNVSVHLWQDDSEGILQLDGLYFNGELVDPGLTSDNATIVDNVVPPADWYGRKYCYIDGEWAVNPNDPVANN